MNNKPACYYGENVCYLFPYNALLICLKMVCSKRDDEPLENDIKNEKFSLKFVQRSLLTTTKCEFHFLYNSA